MQELNELQQKVLYLESLGDDVKSHKNEIIEITNLQNKLVKMQLEEVDRQQLSILREKIVQIRNNFSSPKKQSSNPSEKNALDKTTQPQPISLEDKELIQLSNEITSLESLQAEVKNKKSDVAQATIHHNQIRKMNLTQNQREQLNALRARIDNIRTKFFSSPSQATSNATIFLPSSNKKHEQIIEAMAKSDEFLLKSLQELFRETPNIDVNYVDTQYNTLLCLAVANKKYQSTQFLLTHGANPNFPGVDKTYPLLYAANTGNKEIFKLLLSCGADINCQDIEGNTPLIASIDKKHFALANFILDNYPVDIHKSINEGLTALHHAIFVRSPELVTRLLDMGADPDAKAIHGVTPLELITNLAIQESNSPNRNMLFTSSLRPETRLIMKIIMERSKNSSELNVPTGKGTMLSNIGMINRRD